MLGTVIIICGVCRGRIMADIREKTVSFRQASPVVNRYLNSRAHYARANLKAKLCNITGKITG